MEVLVEELAPGCHDGRPPLHVNIICSTFVCHLCLNMSHHVFLVLVGSVFECLCGQGISSSSHASRPALRPTQLVVDYPTPSPRLIMGSVVLLLFLCVCSGMLLGDIYLFPSFLQFIIFTYFSSTFLSNHKP